jgi:HAD superfamily hydrolase (TIGR01509 family)
VTSAPSLDPPPGATARAVLWDLDGTLVDTEPYWIEAEYGLVGLHGGTWSLEHAHALVGNDLLTSARYLQRHGGIELPAEQIVELLLDDVVVQVGRHVPWRPGAVELLTALRDQDVPCALVTMSYARLAEAVISQLPPATFAVTVTGDVVSRGKPHPEPYLLAAQRLSVAPRDCIAIEDSPTGVASAIAAGMPVLAVEHLVTITPGPGRQVVDTLVGLDVPWLLSCGR